VALAVIVVCASQSLLGAAVVALVRRRQESLDVDELDEVEV
jgi:NADH:ubiquinone oxidoreductase subunit K